MSSLIPRRRSSSVRFESSYTPIIDDFEEKLANVIGDGYIDDYGIELIKKVNQRGRTYYAPVVDDDSDLSEKEPVIAIVDDSDSDSNSDSEKIVVVNDSNSDSEPVVAVVNDSDEDKEPVFAIVSGSEADSETLYLTEKDVVQILNSEKEATTLTEEIIEAVIEPETQDETVTLINDDTVITVEKTPCEPTPEVCYNGNCTQVEVGETEVCFEDDSGSQSCVKVLVEEKEPVCTLDQDGECTPCDKQDDASSSTTEGEINEEIEESFTENGNHVLSSNGIQAIEPIPVLPEKYNSFDTNLPEEVLVYANATKYMINVTKRRQMGAWIMVGLSGCPHCNEARELLSQNNQKVYYFDQAKIDEPQRMYFHKKSQGYTKYPMIFLNGEFIGGKTELKKFLISGHQRIY